MGIIHAESNLLKIPISQRVEICNNILKTSPDESLRGEAVWVMGKTLDEEITGELKTQIENLLVNVLKNDTNVVVQHEASYQLGEHKVYSRIPDLIDAALNDASELVRHESIEALGLLKAFDTRNSLKKALEDPNEAVRQTAQFVLKQLDRYESILAK